jgi:DNA-binding response OmpR family regulator
MQHLRLLLVDDETEFVKTLSERIRIRGLDADYAFSGEMALEMLAESLPDVVVLDLSMPGMEGIEVLRQVKKRYPELPVLILSGHGSVKDEAVTRRIGAFDYLQKPVDIDTLIERVRHAHRPK